VDCPALSRAPHYIRKTREQWGCCAEQARNWHSSSRSAGHSEDIHILARNANRDVALTWTEAIYKHRHGKDYLHASCATGAVSGTIFDSADRISCRRRPATSRAFAIMKRARIRSRICVRSHFARSRIQVGRIAAARARVRSSPSLAYVRQKPA